MVAKQKSDEIKLDVYAAQLDKDVLQKMLGNGYDKVLAAFEKALKEEGQNLLKKPSWSSSELQELADKVENIKYLSFDIRASYSGKNEILKQYVEEIKSIANKNLPEMLRGLADIVEKSGGEIKISLSGNAAPNEKLLTKLKNKKQQFVEDVLTIVTESIKGNVATSCTFEFSDDISAKKFVEALNKVFNPLKKSKSSEIVQFDNARIPKGSLPISINLNENKVEISWPDWIGIGAKKNDFTGFKLGDITPKKRV